MDRQAARLLDRRPQHDGADLGVPRRRRPARTAPPRRAHRGARARAGRSRLRAAVARHRDAGRAVQCAGEHRCPDGQWCVHRARSAGANRRGLRSGARREAGGLRAGRRSRPPRRAIEPDRGHRAGAARREQRALLESRRRHVPHVPARFECRHGGLVSDDRRRDRGDQVVARPRRRGVGVVAGRWPVRRVDGLPAERRAGVGARSPRWTLRSGRCCAVSGRRCRAGGHGCRRARQPSARPHDVAGTTRRSRDTRARRATCLRAELQINERRAAACPRWRRPP